MTMEQSSAATTATAAMGGTTPIKLEDNNCDMNDVNVKTDDEENAMNETTNTTRHHAIKADMDNDHDDDGNTTMMSLPAIKLEDVLLPSVKQQEEEDNNNNNDDAVSNNNNDNGQVATVPTDYSRVEMSGGGGGIQHPSTIHLDTPRTTATDATSEKRSRSKLPPTHSTTVMKMSTTAMNTSTTATSTATTISEFPIGKPILVSTQGNFPSLGSQLGPLFCLGRLGKGTFCSIHKCLQMHYYNNNNDNDDHDQQQQQQQQRPRQQQQQQLRIAAAKVELETFHNSGVLDGEAVVLQHLDVSLPPGTVPKYMGYYKTATTTLPDATLFLSSTSQSQPSSSQQQQQQPSSSSSSSQHACSAIVMEYLQGEDMHQLRDRVVFGRPSRRIALTDAVYLTADVMLPLLQRMHQVGVVHRDVKPSNVVRCGTTGSDRRFCMVDFGLSKSLVVPHDSALADVEHEWHGSSWIRPPPSSGPSGASHAGSGTATTNNNNTSNNMAAAAATINSQSAWEAPPPSSSQHTSSNGGMIHLGEDDNTKPAMAYLRKERPTAEFRGTSMYASLRVHQSKDYCPRDDMWSLLYVFCDLVSGGLPWMSHAANRDREACQKLKEKVHGDASRDQNHNLLGNESPPEDETHQLLMGDLYHLAKYKRDHSKSSSSSKSGEETPLPEPLAMSKDQHKVQLLRTAFAHLATLQFWDVPDYDLIQSCIKSFLDGPPSMDDPIAPISWEHFPSKPSKYRRGESTSSSISSSLLRKRVPTWNLSGRDADDWDEDLFDETEAPCSNEGESGSSHPLEGDDADLARLPLEFRFRLAQMDYNTFHSRSCPMHLALRDFMNVAFPLLEGEWDSRTFEKGNHRSNSDGFRRDLYLKLLDKCLKCADHFGRFTDKSWLYDQQTTPVAEDSSGHSAPASKRRKIVATPRESRRKRKTDILEIARVITDLEIRKAAEEKKNLAPPPRLSFGSGFGMT